MPGFSAASRREQCAAQQNHSREARESPAAAALVAAAGPRPETASRAVNGSGLTHFTLKTLNET